MNNSLSYLATLAAAVLLTTAAGGCRRGLEGREVALRFADALYAKTARVADSTAAYPRTGLEDEMRVVLRRPESGTIRLPLPLRPARAARLEFAYGSAGGAADFKVKTLSPQRSETVLDVSLNSDDSGWHQATVELQGWEEHIELTSSVPDAFFSAPLITRPASKPRPRNLILVSLDTLRADRLGIYGYRRNSSPRMDSIFSTSGLVVENVVSQAPTTLNSHMAMFTGMRPTTAFTPRVKGRFAKQHGWVLNLAEVMRAQGYRTASFTENAWVVGFLGFARGFESYYEKKSIEGIFSTKGHIEDTFSRGLEWMERHRDQAFFLFLHTYQVHSPYTPPPSYRGIFPSPATAGRPKRESDLYDREIRYTDEQVGRLLDGVRELGLDDDTLVVITSDHGEEFGEHGGREHGAHMNSEVLHVPLLMKAPGLLAAGARRKGPMALYDLMPTVLELLDVDIPLQVDGRSFAAYLLDKGEAPAEAIFSEAWAPASYTYDGVDESWRPPAFTVTFWPYRLSRYRSGDGTRYTLYDLEKDPGETRNLYTETGEDLLGPRRRSLDGYEKDCLSRQQALRLHLTGRLTEFPLAPAPVIDKARREKLEALGYLQ